MAVDIQENILIANKKNNRIVVLGPDLNLRCFIEAPECELNGPSALCLDEENQRLFIGNKKRLMIVKVNSPEDRETSSLLGNPINYNYSVTLLITGMLPVISKVKAQLRHN